MSAPHAVAVGFIGKIPLAGMSLYNLHYIAGLRSLGYKVHYVERQNKENECYDPVACAMTDEPRYGLEYLARVLPQFGIPANRWSFIDRQNRCHGSGWPALRAALARADFVLTLSDPTWFDELECCPRRAFVDGDPLFTQVAMAEGGHLADTLAHYNTLFTYGVRMGKAGCTIPAVGRNWIPTRPVVATELWDATPVDGTFPVTTLMNWSAGQDVYYEGKVYGHKNREFQRFLELPRRTSRRFTIAVGGPAPIDELRKHGWTLVNPLTVTKTIEAYQEFIANSRADFGIAKHAYVASRCGWFSDRSTCYLAAGRPVLHQDTGLGDWLPTGEGVLLFSDRTDIVEALRKLDADYERHARKARAIAEEYFEATKVVGRMLDDAGFR